jgi:endonuclease YncB( thermonuclease family)
VYGKGLINFDDFNVRTTEGKDRAKAYTSAIEQVYGIEFAQQLKTDAVIFEGRNLSGSAAANPLENSYSFSNVEIEKTETQIEMPLPEKGDVVNFSEWTAPEKPIDEQFYVAMRWPYLPSASSEAVDKFWSKYFAGKIAKNELAGQVKDYKNSHVLIYNSRNNIAVVCKPAYFLWGEEKSKVFRQLSNTSEADGIVEDTLDAAGEILFSWAGYNADSPSTTPEFDEMEISAVVSPDAAFFLGILTSQNNLYSTSKGMSFGPGYNDMPVPQDCHFAFVPNTVPLGVATSMFVPIKKFKAKDSLGKEIDDFIIGFGNFDSQENLQAELTDSKEIKDGKPIDRLSERTSINEYSPINDLIEIDYKYGGNYATYFQKYLSAAPISGNNSAVFEDPVSREIGLDLLNTSGAQTGDNISGTGSSYFVPVFSIADSISIEARKYYDEDYDLNTSVIAGNGRTVYEAEQIWNQFRIGYHTYDSVQAIFSETFGLDPNDDREFPDFVKDLFINDSSNNNVFKKFFQNDGSARDEFSILFGNEITGEQSLAIEFARKNFIDASAENGGLVEYFNDLLRNKIKAFKDNFLVYNDAFLRGQLGEEVNNPSSAVRGELIKTPRQLFLTLVGIFRQTMWQDPYARAWLVLKPSRKVGLLRSENEQWDFKAVDKIFAAFINPNNTYAKDKKKLMQLLYNNRGEGSSATNILSKVTSSMDNFWDRNVGVIFSAMGSALTGLLQVFKLNMMQAGYGISQAGQLGRQANILNRALNDSIYYQLGRPGSLLRAVDNPFTREYGEPVVEVREPFQRIHYLSSFSHILSNQIKETNNNVSTVITAVSDGKYPVTVALDKGAPPERMNETTVETGIYFDNPIGEGFFGFLHPLLHPFETTRGIVKNVTGSPDELSAKRIALSHLKENIKDIYGGELIVIGNPDIRPHDLVYIADVYERMYGIVEVEQVIHHFTSELGFITSITPNALVTVNDPARWFMTSWIDSWMNTQAIRNDTRLFIDAVRANNSGISSGGNISIDRLSENLNAQMLGGIKYTHGASAVIKDVVASMTYDSFSSSPSFTEEIRKQAQVNGNNGSVGPLAAFGVLAAQGIPIFGQLVWKGWKWVRDNLLDQHGAYVQYLNKNGQPMDAGLSYNQGMVVGRYHSKALLPGILGIRRRARTAEGHAYIRSDDLFKSLGWNEVEINELVRYISYENALVHSQVLGMANLGPEKTTFEPFFKALCKLDTTEGLPVGTSTTSAGARRSGIIDADTIAVVDVISGSKFRVRFDGINAPEQAVVTSQYGEIQTVANIIDKQSPGYKATSFTANALNEKVFLLRIRQDANGNLAADSSEETFAPGSSTNTEKNYAKELYGRTLATVFYKTSSTNLSNIKNFVLNIFIKNNLDYDKIKKEFKNSFYGSIFAVDKVYEKVYGQIDSLTNVDHSIGVVDGGFLNTITAKNIYSNMVEMKILEELYSSASKWPLVLWDEYYDDGTPYTLNWELVANNLASVFTRDLLKESNSVNKAVDSLGIPTKVQVKGVPSTLQPNKTPNTIGIPRVR